MFKHAKNPAEAETQKQGQSESSSIDSGAPLTVKSRTSDEQVTEADLKELIEKNLKWSQIIYEQNRKINNKLLWAAVASWIRTALILIPLILGILFLPSLFRNVWPQYSDLLGGSSKTTTSSPQSLDSLFKLFNIDPAKQEQIKALLK